MNKQKLSKSDIKKACDILRRDDGVGAENYIEQFSWLIFLKVFENVEDELQELVEADGREYKQIIEKEYRWSNWANKDWKDKDELVSFINKDLFPYLKNLKGTPEKEKIADLFRDITQRIQTPHTILDVAEKLNEIKMEHFQDTHLLSQVYEEIIQEVGSSAGWSGEFYTPRPLIRLMIKIVNPKLGDVILDPFVGSAGFLVESHDYIRSNLKSIGVKERKTLQEKTFFGQEKKPLPYLIGTMNMILHRILNPNIIRTNTLMEDVHNIPDSKKVDVILTNPPFGGKENRSVQDNFPIKLAATEALALQYVMRMLKQKGKCGIVLPESDIIFKGGKYKKIRSELLSKYNVHTIISLPKGIFKSVGADVKTYLLFFNKESSTNKIWYYELIGNYTRQNQVTDKDLKDIYKSYQNKTESEHSWFIDISQLKQNNYNLRAINKNRKNKIKELSSNEFQSINQLLKDTLKISKLQKDIENIKKTIPSTEKYEIGNLIERSKKQITINDKKTYKRVTIKLHQKGVVVRDKVKGENIGTKKQFIIKQNQFLISKIDARNGAFGIVSEECDGAIITGNFWAYDINQKLISSQYLKYLLSSSDFSLIFDLSSQGLTNRRYLQEDIFLKQTILLPEMKYQKKVSFILNNLQQLVHNSAKLETHLSNFTRFTINDLVFT